MCGQCSVEHGCWGSGKEINNLSNFLVETLTNCLVARGINVVFLCQQKKLKMTKVFEFFLISE